jgi:hypothetical protein
MSQQNIDFGSFPDDPDADAIRTAFQKVQTNFTELYSAATAGTVTSVNRGAGITVNSPTGNVIVTANIASVNFSTDTLRVSISGSPSNVASITSSSQTLQIDINPANVFSANFSGVSGALANLNGTLTSNSNSQPNITSIGTLANLSVTGNITGGNVYANSGTIGANLLTGTLTTNAQPNITSVGTLGNLSVTGNSNLGNLATANFFSGDGYLLSNLPISAGSSITNGNSNVVVSANGNVTTSVAGTANVLLVSSIGINVAGTLNSTGNANVGNLGTTSVIATGNISGAQLISTIATGTAPLVVTSTTQVANLNVATAGLATYATVANSVLLANVSGIGNIASSNLDGNASNILYGNGVFAAVSSGTTITNGTSNVAVALNGNVTTSVGGTSNVLTVTTTGVNVSGTLNATSITGNFGGNVTNATQANITSLGNLTSLKVDGTTNLGAVGNVIITGGTNGYFLQTNGSGNLSWTNAALVPVPGNTAEVIFNDSGNYSASPGLTFNKTTNTLSVSNITGTLTTAAQPNITSLGPLTGITINGPTIANGTFNTGNVSANVVTANYYIGNGSNLASITGSSVTGTVANATYAVSAGSATTAGTVTTAAQPNITSVGTLTSLTLTATTGTLTVPIITTGANTTAGTITGNWSLSAGSQLRATYADLAEYYAGDSNIEPGTVVEFGGNHEVQICNSYMSRLVAGIVTTNPAYVMNSAIDCEFPIAIALQGRIPAKVKGPVKRGDMMVSSNNGYAVSSSSPTIGTVLGKALTDFNGDTGIIEIMVGRT